MKVKYVHMSELQTKKFNEYSTLVDRDGGAQVLVARVACLFPSQRACCGLVHSVVQSRRVSTDCLTTTIVYHLH